MNPSFDPLIWGGILLVFVIAEAASAQLISIWFAAGALVSLILSVFLPGRYLIQFIVFVAVSLSALIATRPLVKNKLSVKKEQTNADRLIGMTGVVTEVIDGISGSGRVIADGKDWAARTNDSETISEGEKVTVIKIEGVKLIVTKGK